MPVYPGVSYDKTKDAFTARLRVDGRTCFLARYKEPIQAAIARDRAILHYRVSLPLTFPTRSKRLGPASVDDLRKESDLKMRERMGLSQFRGLHWNDSTFQWEAQIAHNGTTYTLGRFTDEVEAAKAYDQAAKAKYGKNAKVNFPDLHLPAKNPEAFQRELRKNIKERSSSRYYGVSRVHGSSQMPWSASASCVVDGKRRVLTLGRFATQREAAVMRDRVVLGLIDRGLLRSVRINFPDAAREQGTLTLPAVESRLGLGRGGKRTAPKLSAKLAKEWHPTKNGGLQPKDVNAESKRRVFWTCPVEPSHVWLAAVASRALKGSGCPTCAKRNGYPKVVPPGKKAR